MKWDSSFAIGIETIDKQHKKIFEYLLAIENSLAKRDPWHILRFFVAQMAEYMKFHLAVEEALLEIIGYPDRVEHRESHVRLMAHIEKLEGQLQDKASVENLVAFFEDWFIGHVLTSDRKYVAYVKEKLPALTGEHPQ